MSYKKTRLFSRKWKSRVKWKSTKSRGRTFLAVCLIVNYVKARRRRIVVRVFEARLAISVLIRSRQVGSKECCTGEDEVGIGEEQTIGSDSGVGSWIREIEGEIETITESIKIGRKEEGREEEGRVEGRESGIIVVDIQLRLQLSWCLHSACTDLVHSSQ